MATLPPDLTGCRRAIHRSTVVGFFACALVGAAIPWVSSTDVYQDGALIRTASPGLEWAMPMLFIAPLLAWMFFRGDRRTIRVVGWLLTLGLVTSVAALIIHAVSTYAYVPPGDGPVVRMTYVSHGSSAWVANLLAMLSGPVLLLLSTILFRLERGHRIRWWSPIPPAVVLGR